MQVAAFVGFLGVLRPRARLYRDCAAAASCSRPSSRCSPSTSPSLSPHRLTPPSRCSTTPSPPLPSAPHLPTHARRADTGILRLPCYQPERVALAAPEEACEHWLERAAVSVSAGMIEAALFPCGVDALCAHAAFCSRLCLGPPARTPTSSAISSSTPMSTPTRICTPLPRTSPPPTSCKPPCTSVLCLRRSTGRRARTRR
ncbi:hypothetical protein C8J57DRAFT_454761 [Mycena rebaudengoi]|nr:hypothetical protein C8J57DRAFT_454761 [Mycena rebaudengoi]